MEEMEERVVLVADHAQRSIGEAVKDSMEQLAPCQKKESSDWSDWPILDSDEFQELVQKVEALDSLVSLLSNTPTASTNW